MVGFRHRMQGFGSMSDGHVSNIDALLDNSGLGPLLAALPSWLGDGTEAIIEGDVPPTFEEPDLDLLLWDFGTTDALTAEQCHRQSMHSIHLTGETTPLYCEQLPLPPSSLSGLTRMFAGIHDADFTDFQTIVVFVDTSIP
jgi:hypothetical protein